MSDVSQPDSRADDSQSPLRSRWQTVSRSLRHAAAFVGEHRRESAAAVVLLMMLSSVVQPEDPRTQEDSQETREFHQIAQMLEEFSEPDFTDSRDSAPPVPTAPPVLTAPQHPTTDRTEEPPQFSAADDRTSARPNSSRPQPTGSPPVGSPPLATLTVGTLPDSPFPELSPQVPELSPQGNSEVSEKRSPAAGPQMTHAASAPSLTSNNPAMAGHERERSGRESLGDHGGAADRSAESPESRSGQATFGGSAANSQVMANPTPVLPGIRLGGRIEPILR